MVCSVAVDDVLVALWCCQGGPGTEPEPENGTVGTLEGPTFRKNPRVRKIFCPQFWGWKWLRQFYGRLKNAFFLQEKAMSIKFLVLGGGGIWVFFGGECRFYFYGREDFSETCKLRHASVFSTHSDTQAVPAFHCTQMFKGIFSTSAFLKCTDMLSTIAQKRSKTHFDTRVSVFKTRVFAHLSYKLLDPLLGRPHLPGADGRDGMNVSPVVRPL